MEDRRVQEYRNDKITVRFDPNICQHSGVCVRGLHAVFDLNARPWINVSGDTAENIVALIQKCPSGALSYGLPQMPAAEQQPAAEEVPSVTLTVVPNGSVRIAGKVRIVDIEGNLIVETEKCSLCRCGFSEKKPFCDGTHKKMGWQAPAVSPPVTTE